MCSSFLTIYINKLNIKKFRALKIDKVLQIAFVFSYDYKDYFSISIEKHKKLEAFFVPATNENLRPIISNI